MTHYYYDKERNEFRGPLDRMPPDRNDYNFGYGHNQADAYHKDLAAFHTYLSTLQPIPHAFSGESRVLVEGKDFEWRYEIKLRDIWEEFSKEGYEQATQSYPKRRVATAINESPGSTSTSGEDCNCGQYVGHYQPECPVHGILIGHIVDDFKNKKETFIPNKPPLTAQPDKQGEGKYWYTDTEFPGYKIRMDGIREFLIDSGFEGEKLQEILKGVGYWACCQKRRWEQSPPSPQTGEKDGLPRVFYEVLNYPDHKPSEPRTYHVVVSDGVNSWPSVAMWTFGFWEVINTKDEDYEVFAFLQLIAHQPPPAQSDQEAAEKYAERWLDKIPNTDIQDAFLAGCTHVRGQQQEGDKERAEQDTWIRDQGLKSGYKHGFADGFESGQKTSSQQPVDAVAFIEWLDKFQHVIYIGDNNSGKTIKQAYALFTSPPPTPKPDSQGK